MNQSKATLGILGTFLAVVAASAQTSQVATPATSVVARGEYLATHVAMCVQCHSPRDEKGEILQSQRFSGGPIPFTAPFGSQWSAAAPSIRSLPGLTDEQAFKLLTEGRAGTRPAPLRPMPPFRMSPEDARAIIAFLRTQ